MVFFVPHEGGNDEYAVATDTVNLAIVKEFGETGIAFAHPMRTLNVLPQQQEEV